MFTYENIYKLSELEIIIYNYVVEHSEKVLGMSIQSLAKETHVSTTTVLRFCRSLGCSGYSEFKVKYKLFLDDHQESFITDNSAMSFSFEKYTQPEFLSKVTEAVTLLKASSGIIWLGFGASSGLCKYGASFFSNSHKMNLVIDDPYFHIQGKTFENTAIIVLSVSGEIDNTIRIIESLKKSQCQIISITNYDNSTLAKLSDLTIPYFVPYQKNNDIDLTTQLPVLYLIEEIGRKLISTQ